MKKILVIAGLDPSGNAGLLRDLQMIARFPLQPQTVVTALTAQNRGHFFSANVVSAPVFKRELDSVGPFQAVKIGMLGNELLVQKVVSFLKQVKKRPLLVLDPVYESTTGGVLLTPRGRKLLWKKLIPLASLWTPNVAEASFFSGIRIQSRPSLEAAAEKLWREKKIPVLIKGYLEGKKVTDLLLTGKKKIWFSSRRVPGRHRGLGCALSSLIASNLALGVSMETAVKRARREMHHYL